MGLGDTLLRRGKNESEGTRPVTWLLRMTVNAVAPGPSCLTSSKASCGVDAKGVSTKLGAPERVSRFTPRRRRARAVLGA